MNNEIEKTNPDDVLAAIQSFNDPNIITKMFEELGWSYSVEIRETMVMAKQNANLSIKFKAIKHLRELLREAAEASGYIANVSSTAPNAQGGHTTFSAKRISGFLNPVKQIKSTEIKEPQNDKIEKTKSNRGCDRRENIEPVGTDTRDVFPLEDVGAGQGESPEPANPAELGSLESGDGGIPPEQRLRPAGADETPSPPDKQIKSTDGGENPCVKTRPPTCDRDLYPGISSAEE